MRSRTSTIVSLSSSSSLLLSLLSLPLRSPSLRSSFSSASPRVAVVGSGPSGLYCTKYLLKAHSSLRVDVIESCPVPFGLVRFGVAPDHPEVKAVVNDFTNVLQSDRVGFFGRVEVGRHVTIEELRRLYDGIIFAYGAQSERRLDIKGRDLKNIFSARKFVNWYNGHPDHVNDEFDLNRGEGCSGTAMVIGQGNVAIDCARMLLTSPELLSQTDITRYALQTLQQSRIERVRLVGRRGPVQAAFTVAELREIASLNQVRTIISEQDLAEAEQGISTRELSGNRPKSRKWALIKQVASSSAQSSNQGALKQLNLDFFLSPVEYLPSSTNSNFVGGVRFEKMRLVPSANGNESVAVGTGQLVELNADIVFESIGYRSLPLDSALPFDQQYGVLRAVTGRVIDTPGMYVSGWLKRGPSGIIGSNIGDARETVISVIEDLQKLEAIKEGSLSLEHNLVQLLEKKGHQFVDKAGWMRIDALEVVRGLESGQSRFKLVNVNEMLAVANS